MATKVIDFIQSEQIVKLEEDVNELKNKLNLLVTDINIIAPKLATIISNLNAVASSIGNNYILLTARVLRSQDSNDHTDGTYTNVSLGGGTGTGAKATVTIGPVGNNSSGSIQSVTITTVGANYVVGDTLTIPTSVIGGSQPGGAEVIGDGTSVDGLLKRLTEFDDDYTIHISRKFPPVVDIRGMVHVGYHVDNTPMKHAHPEGWTGSSGTCLTGNVSLNPNYTDTVTLGLHTNQYFTQRQVARPDVPTNQTWEGMRLWDAMPNAKLVVFSWGSVGGVDFDLDIFSPYYLNPLIDNSNCSYGYGWSVDDEIMSMYGNMFNGVWQSAFHGIVTSVGSQLQEKPDDDTPTYRTPHGYLAAYDYGAAYGDDSPGVGGPEEPSDWGEGGSHNIMDPSNQLDDEEYITTVLNTTVVPSYLSQAQILFMSDEDKIKRAKQLVRMTKNRLRDDSLWKTENVSDGVLTADDFVT